MTSYLLNRKRIIELWASIEGAGPSFTGDALWYLMEDYRNGKLKSHPKPKAFKQVGQRSYQNYVKEDASTRQSITSEPLAQAFLDIFQGDHSIFSPEEELPDDNFSDTGHQAALHHVSNLPFVVLVIFLFFIGFSAMDTYLTPELSACDLYEENEAPVGLYQLCFNLVGFQSGLLRVLGFSFLAVGAGGIISLYSEGNGSLAWWKILMAAALSSIIFALIVLINSKGTSRVMDNAFQGAVDCFEFGLATLVSSQAFSRNRVFHWSSSPALRVLCTLLLIVLVWLFSSRDVENCLQDGNEISCINIWGSDPAE